MAAAHGERADLIQAHGIGDALIRAHTKAPVTDGGEPPGDGATIGQVRPDYGIRIEAGHGRPQRGGALGEYTVRQYRERQQEAGDGVGGSNSGH